MPYTYIHYAYTYTHTYKHTHSIYADERLLFPLVSVVRSHRNLQIHTHTYKYNMDIHMNERSYCTRRAHTINCCCMLLSSNRCFDDVDYFRIELVVAILISYEHDTHVNLFALSMNQKKEFKTK